MDEELGHAKHVLGLIAASLAVAFFGAPLASLAQVMKTKSSEVLPFPLILASFFVSAQWYLYGVIISDSFVKVPNFLGCCLSSFQLLLFLVYPANGSSRKNSLPFSSKDSKPLLST